MKKYTKYFTGFIIGLINSLIGAGGGIIAVEALKKDGMKQNKAHANAIAVILPITIISASYYVFKGYTEFNEALLFIPGGIAGAAVGGVLLSKVPQKALKKVFGAFIIWAGIRMIIK